MKILVVSDTHGHVEPVIAFINNHPNQFDCLWHLGDHHKDALRISHLTGMEVHGVKGNCDPYSNAEEDLVLNVKGYHILLTHGHHYGVKYSLLKLHLKALEDYYDLVCFGHTHIATQAHENGVTLFNPGSAAQPRTGGYPSVGIVEIGELGIKTSIVPLLTR